MKEFFEKIADFLKTDWWIGLVVAGVLLVLLIIVCIAYSAKVSQWKKRALEAEANRVQTYTVSQTTESAAVQAESQEEAATAAPERPEPVNAYAPEELEPVSQPVEQEEPFAEAEEYAEGEPEALSEEPEEEAGETKSQNAAKQKGTVKFMVQYDRMKNSWVIKKEGVERVVRRVATKEEAMKVAKELTKKYDANLMVKKKDGKFQKQEYQKSKKV